MAKANMQMFINIGIKGVGALAVVEIANKFAPAIMANPILAFSFGGVSLGMVVAAGVGIFAAESLLLK